MGLQNVIGGATAQCTNGSLLTDRAGHEYEWRVGSILDGDLQRAQPVKARQGEVGQYQIGLNLAQCVAQLRLGLYAMDRAIVTALGQMPSQQLGICLDVLDDN